MTPKKTPFISSVQLARIDGSTVIPTVIYYKEKKPLVGKEAINNCPSPEFLVEDFKLDIGKTDPDDVTRKTIQTENTPRRTSVGLLKDFFDMTLKKINEWLHVQGLDLPTKILIAEPISLSGSEMADETWLSFYRKAIKKQLHGRFEEIDFLPEPFAVFQYYRYGLRHPLLSEQRKHVALVLDFGGGTFDVSVVETTKAGELSGGGTNSRPLGARSIQVGGFFINRLLAEELLFSCLSKTIEKSKLRKSLNFFLEHKNDGEEFLTKLSDTERVFFRNMKELLHAIEAAKVSICNSIANWSLSANLSGVAPYSIMVPTNPYDPNSQRASMRVDAHKIQSIYIKDVWVRLRDTIITTLERAKSALEGQEISVVLLSGGSSNIRWLRPLLERDLRAQLEHAQILELNENFQEIVAKGLATECARRFYTGGRGDFRAVTYNRLCLLLRPDEGEIETKQFRPVSSVLSHKVDHLDPNVLLPAASSLRGLVGQKIQWKVKLNKLPKRSLNYYFMRSSFDPDDLDSRHNIVDTRVFTPFETQFQQSIIVELVVREDGTAEPRFIYGRNDLREGTVASGTPFYIDMTFAATEVGGETYLGFDFGTSTSACSYVSSKDIELIEQRAKSTDWLELSELVSELPYPAAAPLARYMSEMDSHRRSERGRESVEALLTVATYIALAEISTDKKPNSALFKGMAHRSAGPLWGLLKQCPQFAKPNLSFTSRLPLLLTANGPRIDSWIKEIANSKHGRESAIDYVTFLAILGNHINKALEKVHFGLFEGVTPKRFSQGRFKGSFRILRGSSQSFIHVMEYEGPFSFTTEDVYLINPEVGTALNLAPLYLWGLEVNPVRNSESDLFEYDNVNRNEYGYKSVQSGLSVIVDENGPFNEVWRCLNLIREREQPRENFIGLTFTAP